MPQVYTVSSVARPDYYDRQPTIIFASFFGSTGPHLLTQWATYSPASGHGAYIEMMDTIMTRITAGTVPGPAQLLAIYDPLVGPDQVILNPQMYEIALYTQKTAHADSFGFMTAGDALKIQTVDQGTGGNVYYQICIKGSDFIR